MRQILQNLKTGEVEIADIPVPSVRTGHLLIRTTKSLISLGTERMLLEFGRAGWINKARQQPDKVKQVIQKINTDGLKPTLDSVFNKLDQPIPLGNSNAGVVIEVGKDVSGFKVGDRIASNGSHAEVVCLPVNLCAKIPDNVDDVTASFTVLSAIALQGIRLINPTLGESVAVMGLGLIGLLASQILRANGCRVIGFDFDKSKVDIARKFGAEAYSLTEGVGPVHTALAFSKGDGVDAVLITASTKSNDPIRQAPKMCRKRGRVVLVGVVGLEISREDFYKKEISFQVSCSYGPGRYETNYEKKGLDYPIGYVRWTEQRNFQTVLQIMADGQIKTNDLISSIIPIYEANKAYDIVSSKDNVLGILLDYDSDVDLHQKTIVLQKHTPLKSKPEVPVIGFIGAGNFASSTLISTFKGCNVKLKTIASSGGVSSSKIGKKYGFEINTTDYRSILDDTEINTVVITTQHNTHARFVIEALKSGKHVFVEKPLCINEEELKEIISTYQSLITNNLSPILTVGFNRRFSPLIQKLKKLIESIHEPKCFVMTVNAGIISSDHWTQDMEIGGGRIIGEVCHFIDLLRFLAGCKIIDTGLLKLGDSDGNTVSIRIGFEDGTIGTIHYLANGNKSFPKERLEVFCGGKILQLDNFKTLRGYGYPGFNKMSLWHQDKGHHGEVSTFLNSIEKGLHSPINFEEIVEVTKVCLELSRK